MANEEGEERREERAKRKRGNLIKWRDRKKAKMCANHLNGFFHNLTSSFN